MKFLHTSDWHLGRSLYGHKRYEEFAAFLDWLAHTIEEQSIDALLVAGDIFDTNTPSNRAQELYYRFLYRVSASCCRHIVIIAGNHDSPTFLDAPKELLRALRVYVIGTKTADPQDEVILLRDDAKQPQAIVCAVPYLRDRDIRTTEAGESIEDKEQKLVDGIREHYASVAAIAQEIRTRLDADIPILAMGHLFTAGGQTMDGDGVRPLYVGSLAQVRASIFPSCFSYVALGHLHVPQKVGGLENLRYSGSPLPMGFGEAAQQKSVCIVEFLSTAPDIQIFPIPVFQALESIKGDWEHISGRMITLSAAGSDALLEVVYTGNEVISDLRQRLDDITIDTNMEVIMLKNSREINRILQQTHINETLDDLDEQEVFERCLVANNVAEEQRAELLHTYQQTLASLHDDDPQAE